MAHRAIDRLMTIVVTATLTSAVWVIAGGTIMERARVASGVGSGVTTTARPAGNAPAAAPARRAGMVMVPAPQVATAPSGALLMPVAGVRTDQIVDTFAQARAGGRVHDAIDIMAATGTDVLAAAPGTVEKLFLSRLGGKTIYVRSQDRRTIYYYAHLNDYAAGLGEGQQVARGQRLGAVGYTGNANPARPHLHFAIMQTTPQAKWWEPSTAINPYPLLKGK